MPTSSSPIFPQAVTVGLQAFVHGTDAADTYKALVAGGANGAKITSVMATSTDSATAHVVTLAIERAGTRYVLGACGVPAGSGTSGAAASVDLLAGGASSMLVGLPVDNDGQRHLFLAPGDVLVAAYATALTAATRLNVIAFGASF